MALFVRNGFTAVGWRRPPRPPVLVIQSAEFPEFLKRLRLLCHGPAHPLPVQMKCIGESVSNAGQPMAVYACPFQGCRHREGWVQERHTGRPFRLWGGEHRG